LLAVQTEGQWASFCQIVCEHPEWEHDPRFATASDRRINRDVLETAIEASFAPHTREEITRRIESADIPFGDVNDISQFLDHPQLTARDRWRDIDSPAGPLRAILPPMNLEGVELRMDAIPEVGQHTDEVLREIGYDEAAIAELRAGKAV
jgi:itaconate CoA-transferase